MVKASRRYNCYLRGEKTDKYHSRRGIQDSTRKAQLFHGQPRTAKKPRFTMPRNELEIESPRGISTRGRLYSQRSSKRYARGLARKIFTRVAQIYISWFSLLAIVHRKIWKRWILTIPRRTELLYPPVNHRTELKLLKIFWLVVPTAVLDTCNIVSRMRNVTWKTVNTSHAQKKFKKKKKKYSNFW